MEFLMEYYNRDIMNFEIQKMIIISTIRRMQGEKGLMEEFMEKEGIDTYSYYENEGIMINRRTGEVQKAEKKKPRIPKSLEIVK